jgi:gliding motility-associated-like protein
LETLENAAANGCDSIVNVNLVFLENPEFDLNVELCDGEEFIFNGTTYDANMTSGSETLENAAANGCDSIVNVNLVFLESPEFDLNVELCEGEEFIFNGTTYDANLTIGTETLPNAATNGCDSIVHINVIFLENPEFDLNPELCEGEVIIVNGTTYDENLTTGTEILENASVNGCDSIINVNLTFLATPEFDLNAELCEGEVIIVNGTTYDENMTSGSETLENAASNGCDSIIHVNLTFLETPEFDLVETLCAGESIMVNGNTYDASNPAGTEILEGAAINGCDSIVNISLSFYSVLNASVSGDADICSGESTFITFNFNAAETFSVQYSGENGDLVMLNDIVDGYTLEVSPSSTTTYGIEFIVVSGTNCPVNIESAATVNVSELAAQVDIDQEILCGNSAEGALTATAGSGISPYFYSWSNGGNSTSISNLSAGTYTVQVLDAAGCMVEASATLTAPEAIDAILLSEAPNCFDTQSGNLTIQSISGGAGGFEYSLDGEFFQPLTDIPFELNGLLPGDYSIFIQDTNGCQIEDQVTVPETETLTIDLGPDMFIDLGSSVNLVGIPNFVVDSLFWFPTDSLSTPVELSTLANPTTSTTYTILAFDEDGCPATDEVRIIVNRDVPVYIPTAFSPNGDGVNDMFTIFGGQGVAIVNTLKIFDRWGNAVFESGPFPPNDPNYGWNGKYQGQPMNPAVFVFYTEVIYLDGRKEVIKGDVMLLR